MNPADPKPETEKYLSAEGHGETFESIMQRRIARRGLLKGGLATAGLVLAAQAPALTPAAHAQSGEEERAFESIGGSIVDQVMVAPLHTAAVLIRWGDPLVAGAPPFDPNNQTPEAQAKQFGYNCDYMGWFPFPLGSASVDHGLLTVNHEYTNPELMFPTYDPENPTEQQVNVELEAHGMGIVEVQRKASGPWQGVPNSAVNRRITATTPMTISGPAAGHPYMQTSADPTGTTVLGMLNNCAGGKTPWGTVLTCEENFHQYFANLAMMADDDPRKAMHDRYGLPDEASERRWERFHNRFDLAQEPNEPFRFGWVVEIDPYTPGSVPVKRTALGRFRHEGAASTVTPGGKVVFYSGDDERFEYVYKFVTSGSYNPNDRGANANLMDEGTLYVARFNDDGSGEWMPLVYGQNGLDASNGFNSQADVLLNTRRAGDVLGATKMDRPEDIEPNPVNKKVYIALTNNTRRGTGENPPPDPANPRPENRYGHIIELTEANNDGAATTFEWDIFILCGNPEDESTYFAGFPKEQVSSIANPDNLFFDVQGNLWITSDGQPGTLEINDSVYAVPTEGPGRGRMQRFLNGVVGGEVASADFNGDSTALFVSIQHPGEGGTWAEPLSTWPDSRTPPRPSVVVAWANDGGRIAPLTTPPEDTTSITAGLLEAGRGSTSVPGLAALGVAAAATGALLGFRARRMSEKEDQTEQSSDNGSSKSQG